MNDVALGDGASFDHYYINAQQKQDSEYVIYTNSVGGLMQHAQLQSTNALTNDVTNFTELIYQIKIFGTENTGYFHLIGKDYDGSPAAIATAAGGIQLTGAATTNDVLTFRILPVSGTAY